MLRGGKVVALSSVVEIIKGEAWFGSTVVTGWREGKFLMVLQGPRRGGGVDMHAKCLVPSVMSESM